jgi:anti-anti-sigma regulatory factor
MVAANTKSLLTPIRSSFLSLVRRRVLPGQRIGTDYARSDVQTAGYVSVIRVAEDSLKGRGARQFRLAVRRAVSRESTILLDVTQISRGSRTVLKSLADCLKLAEGRSEVLIGGVCPSLYAVLELVGFPRWSRLFSTREEALRSCFHENESQSRNAA